MERPTRPRRREAARTGAAGASERSARYRQLLNPFVPVRVFSDDEVEHLHNSALTLLERQGMRVLSPRGRAALAAAGASVDESTNVVRMDAAMVAEKIATAPAEVSLTARNPARNCSVGGRHVVFAPVSGPPSVSDAQRG